MNGWNYRVVKQIAKSGMDDYTIHIVHYDETDAPYLLSVRAISPDGGDAGEFMESLSLWNTSLEKPVLIYDQDKHKFVGEEPPVMPKERGGRNDD